jgi:hypothetical protein
MGTQATIIRSIHLAKTQAGGQDLNIFKPPSSSVWLEFRLPLRGEPLASPFPGFWVQAVVTVTSPEVMIDR